MMVSGRRLAVAALAGAAPTAAQAHSFGTPYALPVPLWLYAYGCAATLIVTFALLAWLRGEPLPSAATAVSRHYPIPRLLLLLLRIGAIACLLLTIWAGLAGTDDPNRNVAMTLFWVLFLLGFAYLSVLAGNLYAILNPWRTAIYLLERAGVDLSSARLVYPEWLGSWPALLLYFALIYLELFAGAAPAMLAQGLLVYSAITLAGVFMFGKACWFARADLFSVYFRLIGSLAPMEYRSSGTDEWRVRLRKPLLGALDETPTDLGQLLFVLFMLSSTAYDSIHETELWIGLFWTTSLSVFLSLWGGDLGKAQLGLMDAYLAYRWLGLLAFPFLYFGLYAAALALGRGLTTAVPPLRRSIRLFCNSLLPIAVAYNFAHYFAFFVAQVETFPSLLSDPFGRGPSPPVPEPSLNMGLIWHAQVGAILVGHVASVYLAHLMALTAIGDRRDVIIGQLPLLALMVVYTIFGLWILSLPLG